MKNGNEIKYNKKLVMNLYIFKYLILITVGEMIFKKYVKIIY